MDIKVTWPVKVAESGANIIGHQEGAIYVPLSLIVPGMGCFFRPDIVLDRYRGKAEGVS